jgi:hypothetical protein
MRHALRTVFVLIASGMILIGAMFIGLELMKGRMGRGTLSPWHCVAFSLLILAGIALIWKSDLLARHFSDDIDE